MGWEMGRSRQPRQGRHLGILYQIVLRSPLQTSPDVAPPALNKVPTHYDLAYPRIRKRAPGRNPFLKRRRRVTL